MYASVREDRFLDPVYVISVPQLYYQQQEQLQEQQRQQQLQQQQQEAQQEMRGIEQARVHPQASPQMNGVLVHRISNGAVELPPAYQNGNYPVKPVSPVPSTISRASRPSSVLADIQHDPHSMVSGSMRTLRAENENLTQLLNKRDIMIGYVKLSLSICTPLIAVIVLCAMSIIVGTQRLNQILSVQTVLLAPDTIPPLIGALQKERGMTCLLLAATPDSYNGTLSNLKNLRNAADASLNGLRDWTPTALDGKEFASKTAFQLALMEHRAAVGISITACDQNLKFYNALIAKLIVVMTRGLRQTLDGHFWSAAMAYGDLLSAKELYGQTRAMGTQYFATGPQPLDDLIDISQVVGSADRILQVALSKSNEAQDVWNNVLVRNNSFIQKHLTLVAQMMSNRPHNASTAVGSAWFDSMTSFMGLLNAIDVPLISEMNTYLDTQINSAKTGFVVTIAVVVLIALICPPVMIAYALSNNRMIKIIQKYIEEISKKSAELNREKKRTEIILNQILPASIVVELKANRKVPPETYESVTIFFSDVKGFTSMSSRSSPIEIIDFLNELYTTFDSILDRYDCYKVETIGDAYMIASGLPHRMWTLNFRNGNRHSAEMCTVALNILMEMEEFYIPHMPTEKLLIRIGLHTGTCAAGVVGLKMPRYCLFGDTVNTASRMESTGEPCKIQISEHTQNALLRFHSGTFDTEQRGSVAVKGKGDLKTFWLIGKKDFPYRVDLQKADRKLEKYTYWKY